MDARAPACRRCGAPLRAAASFCGSCGSARTAPSRSDVEPRAFAAIAVAFLGTLVALVVAGFVGVPQVASTLALVPVTLVAYLALPDALRSEVTRPVRDERRHAWVAHAGAAVAVGLVAFGISFLWVGWLLDSIGLEPESDPSRSVAAEVLGAAMLPALVEELLCRGVLWVAFAAVTSRGATLAGTAALFALLHGLNGGFVAELPHRFVDGLGFGLLRSWSGRLWPSVLAHLTLNLTAILAS